MRQGLTFCVYCARFLKTLKWRRKCSRSKLCTFLIINSLAVYTYASRFVVICRRSCARSRPSIPQKLVLEAEETAREYRLGGCSCCLATSQELRIIRTGYDTFVPLDFLSTWLEKGVPWNNLSVCAVVCSRNVFLAVSKEVGFRLNRVCEMQAVWLVRRNLRPAFSTSFARPLPMTV